MSDKSAEGLAWPQGGLLGLNLHHLPGWECKANVMDGMYASIQWLIPYQGQRRHSIEYFVVLLPNETRLMELGN